ncbi:hypothetical protein E1286_45380, partial [Nonomuraea terrae]
MDHWGEIRKLIETRHADRLAERVKELDEEGRKEVAARLPHLLKELRGRFDRWDTGLVDYAIVLRVAGAATLGGAAAVASWLYRRDFAPQWAGADSDVDLVLAVVADRPAAWRADLAKRLALRARTSDDRGMPLALALLRATGVEPPPHDPLVSGWLTSHLNGPQEGLPDDPLLDHLLPRLFEAEGAGRVLQWENDPRRGWLAALPALAESGRVQREMLIDGCVRRFLRGGTPIDLRFFVRLHEALAPSPAESAAYARDYLRLLPASPGQVAELAVKRLRALDDHTAAMSGSTAGGGRAAGDATPGGLTPDDLAEAWESLLFRSERKLVRAGLSWLDRSVRRTPELAGVVAAPLARAFAAESRDLQEKAVELAVAHAAAMDEEGRATVREAIELLPYDLGRRAAEAFPGGTVAKPEPAFAPPLLPAAPERSGRLVAPTSSLAELSDLMNPHIVSWPSWEKWERMLAGFVALATLDRAGLVAALRDQMPRSSYPSVSWHYPGGSWNRAEHWLFGAARSLTGTAPEAGTWRRLLPTRRMTPPHRMLLHRAAEVVRAVEEGTLPPVLLATPTHSTGHVAADELVRRLEILAAAGAKPLAADLQQALLRLPRTPDPEAMARAARLASPSARIVAEWRCPEVRVELDWTCGSKADCDDWHDGSHHHDMRPVLAATAEPTGLPLADLLLGSFESTASEAQHLAWWAATLPSHREVAAAHALPHVLRHHWTDSPAGSGRLRGLARAEGAPGAAFAAMLAHALGDPEQADAVDVLLEVAARDELPADEVGRQAGLLGANGHVKLTDLTAALDAAASRGAYAQVWLIAAAALPALLPAPGQRPRHGLTGFVTLAATTAEWCGAHGEIPAVRDAAARRGTSGLLRELRRLHTLVTAGPTTTTPGPST